MVCRVVKIWRICYEIIEDLRNGLWFFYGKEYIVQDLDIEMVEVFFSVRDDLKDVFS